MSHAGARATRVIKLGGSLLTSPRLRERFDTWLAAQPPATNVIIVGGGALVDAIREIDRVQHFDASTAHWLAIDTMSVTARLAATLLVRPCVDRLAALDNLHLATAIFDVRPYLREEESRVTPGRLPHGWEVTSDSIAAHLALAIAASELVLLKSKLPPSELTLEQLAQSEYVDRFFPTVAAPLPRIRCVDLMRAEIPEVLLGDS